MFLGNHPNFIHCHGATGHTFEHDTVYFKAFGTSRMNPIYLGFSLRFKSQDNTFQRSEAHSGIDNSAPVIDKHWFILICSYAAKY